MRQAIPPKLAHIKRIAFRITIAPSRRNQASL
jgi:hypothetical protein